MNCIFSSIWLIFIKLLNCGYQVFELYLPNILTYTNWIFVLFYFFWLLYFLVQVFDYINIINIYTHIISIGQYREQIHIFYYFIKRLANWPRINTLRQFFNIFGIYIFNMYKKWNLILIIDLINYLKQFNIIVYLFVFMFFELNIIFFDILLKGTV